MKILLIEDNPADIRLMKEGMRSLDSRHQLMVATDGDEAVSLLSKESAPDLVLLDINLPRRDGLDLLKGIRSMPAFAATPVIILSSSSNPEEVNRAYLWGANAYVCKPVSNFFDMLGDLDRFWLKRAVLPSSRNHKDR